MLLLRKFSIGILAGSLCDEEELVQVVKKEAHADLILVFDGSSHNCRVKVLEQSLAESDISVDVLECL